MVNTYILWTVVRSKIQHSTVNASRSHRPDVGSGLGRGSSSLSLCLYGRYSMNWGAPVALMFMKWRTDQLGLGLGLGAT